MNYSVMTVCKLYTLVRVCLGRLHILLLLRVYYVYISGADIVGIRFNRWHVGTRGSEGRP